MKIDPGWRPLGQDRTQNSNAGRTVQPKAFADVMQHQDSEANPRGAAAEAAGH